MAGTQKKDTDSEPRLGINITVKFDFLSEVDIDWFVSLKEIYLKAYAAYSNSNQYTRANVNIVLTVDKITNNTRVLYHYVV